MSKAALHASRLDYAKDRKATRVKLPPRVRVKRLGRVIGMTVFAVDGELIRRTVDVDWTMGGNPSRYGYVPAAELWVDYHLSPVDATATLLHEAVEHQHMQDGMSYENAHDIASAAENQLRDRLELHRVNLKVVERQLGRHK